MKALMMIAALSLATLNVNAAEMELAPRQMILKCHNVEIEAQLVSLPNQKDAQLIVKDRLQDGRDSALVYNDIVRPLSTEPSALYMNGKVSLRVAPVGQMMKGVLNLHRDQPGVGRVLECETFARILPIPRVPSTI